MRLTADGRWGRRWLCSKKTSFAYHLCVGIDCAMAANQSFFGADVLTHDQRRPIDVNLDAGGDRRCLAALASCGKQSGMNFIFGNPGRFSLLYEKRNPARILICA